MLSHFLFSTVIRTSSPALLSSVPRICKTLVRLCHGKFASYANAAVIDGTRKNRRKMQNMPSKRRRRRLDPTAGCWKRVRRRRFGSCIRIRGQGSCWHIFTRRGPVGTVVYPSLLFRFSQAQPLHLSRLPSMKAKKFENFGNKNSLTRCKWSSLNAPGIGSPASPPFLEIPLFSYSASLG